jgi:hypothetical protein
MIYRIFAYGIVVVYAALGAISLADEPPRPREAVIAFLFAASNAAIFCWR